MGPADRFEFKFLITATQRNELIEALEGRLKPDTHGGSGGTYPIVSLYYDSPELSCYWDGWRGLPCRRKLRVRVYGTSDGAIAPTCFVEIKHKADGRGAKRRVQTSLNTALQIAAGGGPLEHFTQGEVRVIREVHQLVHQSRFRPVCVMRYRRHAYYLDAHPARPEAGCDPLRITFDDQIGMRFDQLDPAPDDRRFDSWILPPGQMIMEVKGSGAVPYHFAKMLSSKNLSPRGFSKYSEAIRHAGKHLPEVAYAGSNRPPRIPAADKEPIHVEPDHPIHYRAIQGAFHHA